MTSSSFAIAYRHSAVQTVWTPHALHSFRHGFSERQNEQIVRNRMNFIAVQYSSSVELLYLADAFLFSMPGIKLFLSGRFPGGKTCVCLIFCTVCSGCIEGQAIAPDACRDITTSAAVAAPNPQARRILGIFPNHNTSPCLSPYVPIRGWDKFKIASEDALDPGALVLAAAAGGMAQLFNSNRPFGQEASGYGRYFGAAYTNHVIGAFLTEGVYPSLLHQDPRYFRKGSGSVRSRVGYAMNRVFRTQTDMGGTAFNYSKVFGASSTVAISSLYYANHRDAAGAAVGFGAQIGGAMAANILREFWPDLLRRASRDNRPAGLQTK